MAQRKVVVIEASNLLYGIYLGRRVFMSVLTRRGIVYTCTCTWTCYLYLS